MLLLGNKGTLLFLEARKKRAKLPQQLPDFLFFSLDMLHKLKGDMPRMGRLARRTKRAFTRLTINGHRAFMKGTEGSFFSPPTLCSFFPPRSTLRFFLAGGVASFPPIPRAFFPNRNHFVVSKRGTRVILVLTSGTEVDRTIYTPENPIFSTLTTSIGRGRRGWIRGGRRRRGLCGLFFFFFVLGGGDRPFFCFLLSLFLFFF